MKLPRWRTEKYAIWLACERLDILPPDIKASWDEMNVFNQAEVIAWSQIREIEEAETLASRAALSSPP